MSCALNSTIWYRHLVLVGLLLNTVTISANVGKVVNGVSRATAAMLFISNNTRDAIWDHAMKPRIALGWYRDDKELGKVSALTLNQPMKVNAYLPDKDHTNNAH